MLNVTLIDNYDSFTFNLVHYFGALGAKVKVLRNDQAGVDEVIGEDPSALVLSPGPCTPREAGICLDLIRAASPTIPIFGVCLGHQAIGEAFGGEVVRAPMPDARQGPSTILHEGETAVPRPANGPSRPRAIIRWSSAPTSLPTELEITAKTDDGLIMGLAHPTPSRPWRAVPSRKHRLRARPRAARNFLDLARAWNAAKGRDRAPIMESFKPLSPRSPPAPPSAAPRRSRLSTACCPAKSRPRRWAPF